MAADLRLRSLDVRLAPTLLGTELVRRVRLGDVFGRPFHGDRSSSGGTPEGNPSTPADCRVDETSVFGDQRKFAEDDAAGGGIPVKPVYSVISSGGLE